MEDPSKAGKLGQVALIQAPPESQEVASDLNKAIAFSDDIVREAMGKFWPGRDKHPELNGSGVTEEDLTKKAAIIMQIQVVKGLPQMESILKGAKNPEAAFKDLEALYLNQAEEIMRLSYESLVNLRKAGLDELTGVPNRKVFNKRLNKEIERSGRSGSTFSFIIFDLDHFKKVNDTHGHIAGDQVLKEMAHRLQDVKRRSGDDVMRFGGEEFVFVLPDTPQEGACIAAQRISEQINSEPFEIDSSNEGRIKIRVTASIGISQYTSAVNDPDGEKVLGAADKSLYFLKAEEDEHGHKQDLRGLIACNERVVTPAQIEEYKARMQTRRSSFPTPTPISVEPL